MKEVKSLADISIPDTGSVDIKRGGDTLRIPIRPISQKEMDRITGLFRPPAAPEQNRPDPQTGKIVIVRNEADAAWLEAVKDLETRQTHAVLVGGMDIDIPGNTVEEKWDAISERFTLGEMNIIITAIMDLSSLEDEAIAEAKNSLRRTPERKTATP